MLLLSLAILAQTQAAQIDFAQAWQKTASAIEQSYYGRESRKQEMEDRLMRYAPIATKATSKAEFRNAVEQMIREFRDSHFDFLTDEDQGYYLMDALNNRSKAAEMPEIGAWFKQVAGSFVVQMVLEGGEAQKAGIRKGDIVELIDGQPFSPVASLAPDVDKSAKLSVRRNGSLFEVAVKVAKANALAMFLQATKDSARIIDQGGKKVAYIHLWTQANDDFKNELANEVYQLFSKTDGFILDLRDGFGGRPEGYGDPFFRPQVELDWKFSRGELHEMVGYQRPLVVLINGGSRSAKEVLSYLFKKSHRGVLIGSNTAGNVLGTAPRRLSPWAFLEIPMVEVYADGIRLEGRGVAPDIQITNEMDSNGHDLYTEAALKYLATKFKS